MGSIESSWFNYESWLALDDNYGDIQFNFCTLKKDLGDFKKGTKLACICLMYSESTVLVYKTPDTKKPIKYKLSLKISL